MIISTGNVSRLASKEEFRLFCENYAHIPSLPCRAIGGYPALMVDHEKGLRSLLIHLIRHHGYRKIVAIRGSASNFEAETRFKVYLKVLEEEGTQNRKMTS